MSIAVDARRTLAYFQILEVGKVDNQLHIYTIRKR